MKSRQHIGRPGTLTDATVRRIRRVFDARAKLPSDDDLAAEVGISKHMVRKVGRRQNYQHVADDCHSLDH